MVVAVVVDFAEIGVGGFAEVRTWVVVVGFVEWLVWVEFGLERDFECFEIEVFAADLVGRRLVGNFDLVECFVDSY